MMKNKSHHHVHTHQHLNNDDAIRNVRNTAVHHLLYSEKQLGLITYSSHFLPILFRHLLLRSYPSHIRVDYITVTALNDACDYFLHRIELHFIVD
jgi:hypothetical protein